MCETLNNIAKDLKNTFGFNDTYNMYLNTENNLWDLLGINQNYNGTLANLSSII